MKSAYVAKWIRLDKHIVVSCGSKIYFLKKVISYVFLNINLASAVAVYCKIALIVPCLTSKLLLPSS
jgi:hypothetical protein